MSKRANGSSGGASYQQLAYDAVKARVLSLDLKPGQYVTDSQVAQTLGVSRTPVREALRRLEQEGLLTNEARRGWRVCALSLEDIHEIFEIKRVTEGMMARKAALCTEPESRQALAAALEDMQRAAQGNDYEAWRQADQALHATVRRMAHNERAGSIVGNLDDQWFRLRAGFVALEGRIERSAGEHEAIVSSILAGDAGAAERHMQAHIENVQQELERVLKIVLTFVQAGV